jgi:prophage antirepressor-like protein
MNELKVFESPAFGRVRTTTIAGEPWFVGKDVATALGYSNPRDAISKHVDDEDKGVAKCDTLGGEQQLTIINESGLYSLILSSKLPTAKTFKRWVTSEVLPAIRKTGAYSNPQFDPAANTPAAKRAEAMELNAKSRVARQMMRLWTDAGVAPQYQALALNGYYNGLELPRVALRGTTPALLDKTTIAKHLGIASKKLKPHAQAVGAIIDQLTLGDDEWMETPYSRNGHDGVDIQYTKSVEHKVMDWIKAANYPNVIVSSSGKKYVVAYIPVQGEGGVADGSKEEAGG